jgi:solute carrier family 13 (sodium-dependent dicarboxylate transporter), member 2/3/5
MWTILLERAVRPGFLVAAALLYWLIATRSPPPDLGVTGLRALGVFATCLLLWISGALPLMVTSILALVLLPMAGVLPASETYPLFGNEAVFFILGVFMLAACLIHSGLSTRLALLILRRFGHTPRTLLLSVFLLNAAMSCFMAVHAVAAMNFPIVLEMIRFLRLPRHGSNYARALLLAMAWGSTIGSVATLLGGARGPLALGIVSEATGDTISFLEWAIAAFPVTLLMLPAGWMIITGFYPIDVTSIREADEHIAERTLALGRMSYREKAISAVMLVTLGGWILGGEQLGLAGVALASVVSLFALGLVTWDEVEEYVNWGVLLMYGGAIALGKAVSVSGAALWMSQHSISHWANTGPGAVAIISGLSIGLTEMISNSAVVAMLMPVTLGVADALHIAPRVMALVVAVPCGLAFAMPIGTPANAIAYSSGYLRLRDMLLPGLCMAVSGWLVFNLVARFYWPLLGLAIGRVS